MNRRQEMFVEKAQQVATDMVALVNSMSVLAEQYAEEFMAGKPNVISDVDLESRGITAAAIGQMRTFQVALSKFWTGQAVTTGEYGRFMRAIMSGYR